MKSLPNSSSLHQQFPASRLYRDDLERVIGIMQGAGLEVTISDAHFEYDSLDELKRKVGGSVKEFAIVGRQAKAYESASLSKKGRYWYVQGSAQNVLGVAREVEAILLARQSRIHGLPLFWMLQLGNALFLGGNAIKGYSQNSSVALLAIGLGLIISASSFGGYWLLYPKAVLGYPHEVGFFARNRDAMVLLVVGAVLGGVIQYLTSRFLPTK